jgi:spore germination protein KC
MRPAGRTIIIIILCSLAITGCWNRRDPELFSFVTATGFDIEQDTGLYKCIVEIANPIGSGSDQEGSGGSKKLPFWVVEARGHTPFEARQNLALITSRELYWTHSGVLAIGEDLARQGIKPVLDLFARERQFRLTARPLVVKGDLKALFEADFPLEENSGEGLRRQAISVMFERTFYPTWETRDLLVTLAKPGYELLIGRVEELGSKEDTNKTAMTPPAKTSGGAVFRGDKMVGWIGEREVAGWHWLTGKATRATLIVLSPIDRQPVSVEIFQSNATLTPEVNGDQVTIKVQVKAKGRIQDQVSPVELTVDILRSLERRVATVIKNDMQLTLASAQKLNSDFIGLGNLIYRKLPRDWERLEPRWEAIFPQIQFDFVVEANITGAGLIK